MVVREKPGFDLGERQARVEEGVLGNLPIRPRDVLGVVDVFRTFDASFVEEDRLFEEYYRFFDERMRQHRIQPFFNAVESPGERDAFVKALGVTHILVNPTHYDELRRVLDGLPGQFVLRYTHKGWAIYEVKDSGPAGGGVKEDRGYP